MQRVEKKDNFSIEIDCQNYFSRNPPSIVLSRGLLVLLATASCRMMCLWKFCSIQTPYLVPCNSPLSDRFPSRISSFLSDTKILQPRGFFCSFFCYTTYLTHTRHCAVPQPDPHENRAQHLFILYNYTIL